MWPFLVIQIFWGRVPLTTIKGCHVWRNDAISCWGICLFPWQRRGHNKTYLPSNLCPSFQCFCSCLSGPWSHGGIPASGVMWQLGWFTQHTEFLHKANLEIAIRSPSYCFIKGPNKQRAMPAHTDKTCRQMPIVSRSSNSLLISGLNPWTAINGNT